MVQWYLFQLCFTISVKVPFYYIYSRFRSQSESLVSMFIQYRDIKYIFFLVKCYFSITKHEKYVSPNNFKYAYSYDTCEKCVWSQHHFYLQFGNYFLSCPYFFFLIFNGTLEQTNLRGCLLFTREKYCHYFILIIASNFV